MFNMAGVLRNCCNTTTVPRNGISISFPASSASVMPNASASATNVVLDLLTASVMPVASANALKCSIILDMASDMAMLSANDLLAPDIVDMLSDSEFASLALLNAAMILAALSFKDMLSDTDLRLVNTLATESDDNIASLMSLLNVTNVSVTLSVNDVAGSTALLSAGYALATVSVISLDFCVVSNTALSNMLKSNNLPLSYSLLMVVGVMYDARSVMADDSDSCLIAPFSPVIASDMLIDGPVRLLKLDAILPRRSMLGTDSDTLLVAALLIITESVTSTTPPLLVSNTAASNTAFVKQLLWLV